MMMNHLGTMNNAGTRKIASKTIHVVIKIPKICFIVIVVINLVVTGNLETAE